MPRKPHALLLALALLPACDPLLYAELEVPEFRITLPSQTFPASAAPPTSWCVPNVTPDCIATELQYDLGTELPIVEEGVSYDLRLKRVAIALATSSAGTDLSGIVSAEVSVLDPAGGAPTVVAAYARDDAAPPPTSLAVAGNSDLDLQAYVEAGNLGIRVEMVLDAATPSFQADVGAAFSLDVKVDWGEYL